MANTEGKSIFSNLIWRFLERFGAQLVALIVSVVLARILDPDVYGTIALVTVITTILQVFVDSGLGVSLIQKKDADNLDFSSVFYFNIVMCLFLYVLVFALAPAIASFYNRPDLVPVIRVLSLTIVISGVKNVQEAYVSRNMLFKKFFFATLGGTIGAAIIGILMALKGAGVWALVAQHLFNLFVDTIILWVTVNWRPIKAFSFERLKGLLSFGWKLLACSLVDSVYNNIRQLIIGKKYTTSDLAFYNKSEQLTYFLMGNVNSAINSVMLPALSKKQDSIDELRLMMRKAIRVGVYCIAPMLLGFSACADSFIKIVLTEKWMPCVPYIRLFCITYIFYPVASTNISAYKAIGKSDFYLKIDIIQKIVGFVVLLCSMWFGPLIMAYSLLIVSIVNFFVRGHYNRVLFNYMIKQQISDLCLNALPAVLMFGLVYTLNFLPLGSWVTLIVQIAVGIAFYLAVSHLFKIYAFLYMKEIVFSHFLRKESSK